MTAATERIAEGSPRSLARLTGALFLLTIVAGIIAQAFISERLVDAGNATQTAANIIAQESLFRLGFTIYMIEMAAQIGMTVLFYQLLKPVSRTASLLAAVFGLTGCTIKILSRLFYLAPLLVLGNAPYLSVFEADQLQALALLFIKLNDQAAGIALAFFGLSGVMLGYLVLRSTFLPRWLGALKLAGGLGWMTFLSPSLGMLLFPLVAAVGILGALATIVWLLTVGVDEQRWRQQARLAAASRWK